MQGDVEIVAQALIVPLGHDRNADWARVYVGNGFEADGSLKALCLALADAAMTATREIDAAAADVNCQHEIIAGNAHAADAWGKTHDWLTQRAQKETK